MRDPDNILGVMDLGVDWMGFIFYPKSPRYVCTPAVEIPKSALRRVGVFVDEPVDSMLGKVREYGLGAVQLHGNEGREVCEDLRAGLPSSVLVIKAISVKTADDLMRCHAYEGVVDYFLFDTKCDTKGGSGRQFDWAVLNAYDAEIPFLLSGGIGPEDAERVKAFRHPRCMGIDLNSRFEKAPGLKDISALRHFLASFKDKE